MTDIRAVTRLVVALAVVLPAVLFSTSAADPVNVVKLTALVLCAVALVATGMCRAALTRRLSVPWGVPAGAALALLLAFAVAAVTSPATTGAIVGAYGRNSGLLSYASAVVVLASILIGFTRDATRTALHALMGAGGFTAAYGLLQYVGVDAVDWNNPNPVIAAMGNPNFASGYVAICLPAFVWGALSRGSSPTWRALSAIAAGTCLLVSVLSQSVQGPIAAAAGGAVLVVAWLLDQSAQVRRTGLAVVGAIAASGVAVLAWGAAGGGPVARVFTDTGSRARGWFWEAAFAAWREAPWLGVGLENFTPAWLRERSVTAIRGLGGEDVTSAAHSVPLHLLTTGGLLLFLAYVAFVGVTACALVAGLRRLHGRERLLLGALGGCWAAYQVQSFVSIDQVPLLVAHFVLAGSILVAAGWASTREVALPGATAPAAPRRRGRAPQTARQRRVSATDRALVALVALCALGVAWMALLPLRADVAARSGDVAVRNGDGTPGLMAYRTATDLLPGQPRYWQRLGELLLTAEQPAQALAAFRRGMEADPNDAEVVRGAARAAEAAGDAEAAAAYHRAALGLHPYSPRTVRAAAQFELQRGRAAAGADLVGEALRVLPQEATLWVALGELRAASGDERGARHAVQRALALDGQVPGAAELLTSLDAGRS